VTRRGCGFYFGSSGSRKVGVSCWTSNLGLRWGWGWRICGVLDFLDCGFDWFGRGSEVGPSWSPKSQRGSSGIARLLWAW